MAKHSKDTDSVQLKLTRPIVLVGLMGAGKTTVGKRLAAVLGVEFKDSDHEIVESAGCSISDIFELYGEVQFRDLERRVMLRLVSGEPCVLATGGGAFMNTEIREAILKHATSIWLRADLDVLVERVSRKDSRPLLKTGDKHEILGRLIEERSPTYALADITIDSGHASHEKVVDTIIRKLDTWKL